MPTTELELAFPGGPGETLPALYDRPARAARSSFVLLAHGAGAGMDSDFMTRFAGELVGAGFPVLRFEYAYRARMRREGGRRPPDRAPTLLAAHRAAIAACRRRRRGRRLLLVGKSLGGRMASMLAAEGEPCDGLCLLGYPLHPAKQPQKLRSAHFADVAQPALFLQGTRDALCDLKLMRRELRRFRGAHELSLLPEADHDFKVPKRSGLDRAAVIALLASRFEHWERTL